MENFTIHIFGYGETQINSQELSKKVKTKNLTKVKPLIEAIFAKKPADNTCQIERYHSITIFGRNDFRWTNSSKELNGFRDNVNESLIPHIDALISELGKK